ncbi:MAG: G1 family glutamic endopeptidase [Chloroflexota bacterium]
MKTATFRALFLGLVSLTLAACAPTTAISQARGVIQSHLPGASPAASSSATAPESEVQLVILRGDLEQERAIASKDSSGMKDTSTDNYYQQVSQQNQGLLDGGVTGIKLVNVEWGAVTINGGAATVNNFETWATTYDDGSSDQSRDHNIYTLIQQNGAWKIQSDDQPDSGSTSPQPAASTAPQPRASTAPQPSGRGGGRPGTSANPSASATPAPAGATSLSVGAQTGTPEAAIQQLILKGNGEQEQAIASKDSTVMKDTSTDTYYQDLAQTNQDMLDSGVTAIRLVKIEWGQTTVTGTSGTATTYETWWTQYSDGSTDQSRDRNVYSLVQQNGAWKIQSDDHPDNGFTTVPGSAQPGNPAPSGGPAPSPQVPAPRPSRGRGVSSNWSGYAANGGKFTSVSGTWTVPQPSANTGSLGADAAWVGIGGENSRDLIQAGTEETVLASGTIHYDAWIEMLPQYSHPIPLAVHPGDSVTVSISQQPDSSWKISFKNNTTTNTYDRTVQYSSSLSSAEWIEEAPSGGRGGVMPLDNFGNISFSSASAVKDGQTVNLSQAGAQPITMINGNDQPLVTPAAIAADGSSFTLTRTSNAPTGRGGSGFPRGRTS